MSGPNNTTGGGIAINYAGVNYVDETTLAPGNYHKPLILDRIFKLLVEMINELQKTAAAQAQRLNFLTEWQKAYTDEMNQIHAFVAANGDGQFSNGSTPLDHPTDSAASQARQNLNQTNTNYTQQLQGNNSVISNDAKALQSNVNQTNDAVQAQTDMATSILQQLSTILSSIYQG